MRWETERPEGAIFHVGWFPDGGITVMDVYESQEQFDRFMQDRLMPAFQQIGLEGQPDVEWFDAHAVFNPGARVAAGTAV